jgi:cytochrome b subunit of formate dehydrogenase
VGTINKTCSACHESQRLAVKFGLPVDRLQTYLQTYHGLAYQRGDLRVANCSSCHGWHDVLPSTDPRSSINPLNIANTCGRCHPGAGEQLKKGYVHGAQTGKHWILEAVRKFYFILIPVVVCFMLLHNGLDLLRKMIAMPAPGGALSAGGQPEDEEDLPRLTVNERWQHAFLMLTFILLAISGFALKFPDASWAKILMPVGEEARRWIHRWMAAIFCLLGGYHVGYLAFSRRGRWIFKELLPRWRQDARALFQHFAYTLGRRKAPPNLGQDHFHYAEKIEYWALVWGSVMMVVTGALLVFTEFTLRHFPLWISDLATFVHYYEAVLACLAIVIWHFYGVIFDPNVYPMSWAWLTGYIRRRPPNEKRKS